MKYFVIESSPFGKKVIGNFNTKLEAEKKIDYLIPISGTWLVDYYITKLIS